MREKRDVQRLNALADDEEQDKRERHQCEDDRARAEGDEQRRQQLPTRGRRHVASSTGSVAMVSVRVMLQIRSRENELMISVMMNRTRPISISADR